MKYTRQPYAINFGRGDKLALLEWTMRVQNLYWWRYHSLLSFPDGAWVRLHGNGYIPSMVCDIFAPDETEKQRREEARNITGEVTDGTE